MSFNEQFTDLLAIQKPCIQIRTNLEKELFPVLLNLLYSQQYESIYRIEELDSIEKITVSSAGKIIRQKVEGEYGPIQFNPNLLLGFVRDLINNPDEKENAAFIFMDYDSKFDNSMFRRWIKNIFELKNDKYAPFIFVSSKPEIPDDLKHLFSVVYYDNPTEKEIVQLLKDYKAIKKVEINDINNLAHKFIGFNRTDIIECLNYSFYKFGEINDSYIKEKRVEVIKKSSVIVYKEPRVTMTDIAGNHYFKQWYEELKYCFDSDAQKYGVNKPKGYLALGPAGTAKSLGAEAIASDLNIPLLSLDMSKLLSKFVGESERNIDEAINIINQVAPCVLLIDEVEKALGGYKSSNASDSGTLARVFGKVLNLLADNDKGIFTVMTSNNVKDLPPELTRAGRLDAIFYFGYGDAKEREEIFKLHFEKRGHKVSDKVIKQIAKETNKYTGAEIEQIVVSAIKKAFVRMKKNNNKTYKITEEDLKAAKTDVIPISVSSKETVTELENWAKGRAIFANKTDNKVDVDLDNLNIDDIL